MKQVEYNLNTLAILSLKKERLKWEGARGLQRRLCEMSDLRCSAENQRVGLEKDGSWSKSSWKFKSELT